MTTVQTMQEMARVGIVAGAPEVVLNDMAEVVLNDRRRIPRSTGCMSA
jgi:hypothetical protein